MKLRISAPPKGQPVQQLSAGNGHELCKPIPRKHEAVDAGCIQQPHQRHTRDPREPAEAAMAIEAEMAHQVQHHRHDHAVGCVAMQAAHDAAEPPLGGQPIDRHVCLCDAGLEEGIQVQPCAGDDPEQEERDLAEVVERIEPVAEGGVERRLHAQEHPPPGTLESCKHSQASCRSASGAGARPLRPRPAPSAANPAWPSDGQRLGADAPPSHPPRSDRSPRGTACSRHARIK